MLLMRIGMGLYRSFARLLELLTRVPGDLGTLRDKQ